MLQNAYNPLITRVKRHGALAVLFRQSDSLPAGGAMVPLAATPLTGPYPTVRSQLYLAPVHPLDAPIQFASTPFAAVALRHVLPATYADLVTQPQAITGLAGKVAPDSTGELSHRESSSPSSGAAPSQQRGASAIQRTAQPKPAQVAAPQAAPPAPSLLQSRRQRHPQSQREDLGGAHQNLAQAPVDLPSGPQRTADIQVQAPDPTPKQDEPFDREWARLQTIIRRHRTRQAMEMEGESPTPVGDVQNSNEGGQARLPPRRSPEGLQADAQPDRIRRPTAGGDESDLQSELTAEMPRLPSTAADQGTQTDESGDSGTTIFAFVRQSKGDGESFHSAPPIETIQKQSSPQSVSSHRSLSSEESAKNQDDDGITADGSSVRQWRSAGTVRRQSVQKLEDAGQRLQSGAYAPDSLAESTDIQAQASTASNAISHGEVAIGFDQNQTTREPTYLKPQVDPVPHLRPRAGTSKPVDSPQPEVRAEEALEESPSPSSTASGTVQRRTEGGSESSSVAGMEPAGAALDATHVESNAPLVAQIDGKDAQPSAAQAEYQAESLPRHSVSDRSVDTDTTPLGDDTLSVPSSREHEGPVSISGDPPSSVLPRQALPLEAGWPVQRVESITSPVHPSPRSGTASLTDTSSDIGRLEIDVLEGVQDRILSHMQSVHTGQPTESQIDLVLPLRPRPRSDAQLAPHSSARSPSVPERTQTRSRPQKESSSPMVSTEIGPLPADLWELIGHRAPSVVLSGQGTVEDAAITGASGNVTGDADLSQPAARSNLRLGESQATASNKSEFPTELSQHTEIQGVPGTQSEPAVRTQQTPDPTGVMGLDKRVSVGEARPAAFQRSGSVIHSYPKAATPLRLDKTSADFASSVQRQPAPDQEPGSVPVHSDSDTARTDDHRDSDLNLDELAQAVYAQIRHRLTIEWERLHRSW